MITVREFLKTLTGPDRIKIVKDKEILFVGYRADGKKIPPECLDAEMKMFRSEPEIRHREWKKRGLMPPLEPDQTPDFKFSDLEMKLYYKIYI